MSVMWVGAAATVASAAIGANASSKASKAQQSSADAATNLQREQFDRQVELQDPFRRAGLGAQNQLMTLLGIKPGDSAINGGASKTPTYSNGGPVPTSYVNGQTDDPVWEQLLEKANADHQAKFGGAMNRAWDTDADSKAAYQGLVAQYQQAKGIAPDEVNEGLGDPNDPAFGSLMKDFTKEDFLAGKDPGYQFLQDEGMQALDRSAAGRGGLQSGRAMKDTLRFSQGLASQEYGNAFNRFQTNRSNKLNPLQSLMGSAQTSTNTMGNAAGNFANSAGSNIIGAGNARAAGYVGTANAINSGVGQGVSMYQNNQLMNKMFPQGGGSGYIKTFDGGQ